MKRKIKNNKQPNIQARLVSGLIVLFITITLISILYYYDVNNLNNTINSIIRHPYTVSNSVRDIDMYINAMHRSMKDVTLAKNDHQLNQAIFLVNEYESLVYKRFEVVAERFLGNPEDVKAAYNAFVSWKKIRDEVIKLTKQNKIEQAADITKGKEADHVEMLLNKTEKMIEFANNKANEYNEHSLKIFTAANRKAVIYIISAFIISVITFIWIIQSINKPLDRIISRINTISPNHFINQIPENRRNKLIMLDFVFNELEDNKILLEQQVNERTKELKNARKLLENAIDNAAIGMVMINFDGILTNVNQAFCDFIGYNAEELISKKYLDILAEKNIDKKINHFNKLRNNEIDNTSNEIQFSRKDGKVIFGSITSSLVYDSNDKPLNIFAQIKDITQQKNIEDEVNKYRNHLESLIQQRTDELNNKTKKLEKSQLALTYLLEDVNESREELKILNEQIDATNKELEAFSYSVSHDLKAPLRAVTGFSQILAEEYTKNLNDEAKRYISLIIENAKNMGILINDLLNYSRMGQKEIHKQEVDIKAVAEKVRGELLANTDYQNISIVINSMPPVLADQTLIYQVMLNLISNAVKFSANLKNSLIEIGYINQKKEKIYYVKDNGIGFDMKYADKIFDVFQRLHNSDEYEGTGIGLAIVKRIIHKHKGKIWVKSKTGKGTTFYFTL